MLEAKSAEIANAKIFFMLLLLGKTPNESCKLYHLWRVLMRLLNKRLGSTLLVIALLAGAAQARVVRVEISSRADVESGKPFGSAGPYEKLTGRELISERKST